MTPVGILPMWDANVVEHASARSRRPQAAVDSVLGQRHLQNKFIFEPLTAGDHTIS